jgi:hypothetical protein
MSMRRRSIKLLDHERRILVDLYLRWRIPVSQFKSRPEDKQAFVDEWNRLSGRKDAPCDVIHYMKTRRKRALWVRLDGEHKAAPPKVEFSAEETEVLVDICRDLVIVFGNGSDTLDYDDEVAAQIAKAFLRETGRMVPAHELVTKFTALRKRGHTPKVKDQQVEKPLPLFDGGFTDIQDAE